MQGILDGNLDSLLETLIRVQDRRRDAGIQAANGGQRAVRAI